MSEERGPAPELGGPSDTYEVERASATPLASFEEEGDEASRDPSTPGVEPVRGPLADMLAWFAQGVMGSIAAEPPIARMLTAGPKLSATNRLHVYRHAYRARLIECLADDYPAVKYATGDDGFDALASDYIDAYPSRSPSLNIYGQHFASFAASRNETFVADLARLEWAMVEVLHAAPSPVLSMSMLQELPPEAWAGIRFEPAPPLRFHEFEYPVNKYLRAQRMDESPSLPEPAWSATAVYRKHYTIWRMDFTAPMAKVMSALLARETLGDALSSLPEELAGDVMIWFKEWVAGGFFARIQVD